MRRLWSMTREYLFSYYELLRGGGTDGSSEDMDLDLHRSPEFGRPVEVTVS